jgi:hypothetical protein
MQRPPICILGIVLASVAAILRLNVGSMFTSFSWSANTIQISRDYQNMLAWIDIFNIAIVAGLALAIIGWLLPPSRGPGAG